jgi:N-methylhydantoinase B
MRRVIRLLAPEGAISFVSDKNVVPPFGVHSGFSGGPNRFGVIRDGRELTLSGVPGKVSGFPLKQDDRILEQSSGGGGYGDPLEREPARVASDVAEGYISLATAEAAYGVILRDGQVDLEATEARRRELQEQRVFLTVEALRGEETPGGYRAVVVAPSAADALQAKAGDLVECLALKHPGAPLRAWLRIDPGLPRESCRLGPGGLVALGLREGERTWVRKVVLQ